MKIELRWLRLRSPPFDRVLQFREIEFAESEFIDYGEWQDVSVEDQK